MSNFLDSLQVELIFSLIIMVVMAIFFIYAGKKFATADPTARPKGVVLVVETGVKMIYDYLKSIMPKKFEKNYYPYFAMLFAYLVIANLSGLLGFEAPTSNYSITLALTTITFCLIQFNAIKKQGLLSYICCMATNKLIKYSFAIDFVINAFIWEYFKWIDPYVFSLSINRLHFRVIDQL